MVREGAEQFHRRALAFALSQEENNLAEDLAQEMVIEWLSVPEAERPRRRLSYLYEHAKDRLNPRRGLPGRPRKSSFMVSENALLMPGTESVVALAAVQEPRDVETYATLPRRGWLRALLLLELQYGFSRKEIGYLLGLGDDRVSKILGSGKAEVLAYGAPDMDLTFDLEWMAW